MEQHVLAQQMANMTAEEQEEYMRGSQE